MTNQSPRQIESARLLQLQLSPTKRRSLLRRLAWVEALTGSQYQAAAVPMRACEVQVGSVLLVGGKVTKCAVNGTTVTLHTNSGTFADNGVEVQTLLAGDLVAVYRSSVMAQRIVIKPSQVRAIIDATFPDYRGPKAAVVIQATAEYRDIDLNWSGGSITYLKALRVQALATPGDTSPFQVIDLRTVWGSGQGYKGAIPCDVMLVEHVISCGHDLGIRCVVSPDSQFLPRLALPVPVELTDEEVFILSAHAQLKSSHREQAYLECVALDPDGKEGCFAAVVRIKAALTARGLLSANKLGATSITNDGRNALAVLPAERQVRL